MDFNDRSYGHRVAVVGASGHGRVVADILEMSSFDTMVGYFDDGRSVGDQIGEHLVLGRIEDIREVSGRVRIDRIVVGIGDNATRAKVAEAILKAWPTAKFTTAIHPSASVARSAKVLDGTVVMAGAVIGAGSTVGHHCIVNTNASLDHDSELADFASMAPMATTGGNVRIGRYSAISIGAVVKHSVRVGQDTVVGANSTVLADIGDGVIAYGTPARTIRPRVHGDRYL
ncbi:acetyltransferase [Devosia sp.]|uniref:acetyltransferase n=1 Tax=Devosia sp. TaxID=1871048 RepID=UPI0025DEAFCA|nr:acetyltransferase [Devosia sp.]MCR6636430.1 acetyltransferase [Devosia sp.]